MLHAKAAKSVKFQLEFYTKVGTERVNENGRHIFRENHLHF